ncbi:MAG: VOC family protein [Anaerolineales bacterium]
MTLLRLELFTRDLEAARRFYAEILDFKVADVHPDGYTVMKWGKVRIDLQPVGHLRPDHPVRPGSQERVGLGIEIVLEVEDVVAVRDRVAAGGWPLASALQGRPWGARDFRVLDPDGRYVRITSPSG